MSESWEPEAILEIYLNTRDYNGRPLSRVARNSKIPFIIGPPARVQWPHLVPIANFVLAVADMARLMHVADAVDIKGAAAYLGLPG